VAYHWSLSLGIQEGPDDFRLRKQLGLKQYDLAIAAELEQNHWMGGRKSASSFHVYDSFAV
jgi:hypothetical protein